MQTIDIFCPACSATNAVNPTRVRARCRTCNAEWTLGKNALPPFASTAARNETSVLFTVDTLRTAHEATGAEGTTAPLSEPRPPNLSEDGIIDLHALGSKGPNGPVGPLFASEPPPAAFSQDVPPNSRSRVVLGAVGALVVAALCSVAAFAFLREDVPDTRRATTAILAPAVAPLPSTPSVQTASAPEASPESAAIDPAPAEKTTKSSAKPHVKIGGKSKSGAGKVVMTAAAPAVRTPKPAADKCGCKGDFNCILRCAAGK